MWKKATTGAVLAAALLGTAGVAMASADGTTPAPGSTTAATKTPTGVAAPATDGTKHRGPERAGMGGFGKGVQHAQWVAKDKAGAFVTHDAISGDVTAASATSVTVKAEDGVSLTFAVTADTKIRLRPAATQPADKAADKPGDKPGDKAADKPGEGKAAGKGTAGTSADLKVGQHATVTGTGTDALTAAHVVVRTG